MSILLESLKARGKLEALTVRAPEPGLSRDGLRTFMADEVTSARVREEVTEVLTDEGTRVRLDLTLWIPGSENVVPARSWQVERAGHIYVVESVKEVTDLRGTVSHTKLGCRRFARVAEA